ncbi:MAG: hypothetical protein RLZ98_303 [Pseudomonadota bacterium]
MSDQKTHSGSWPGASWTAPVAGRLAQLWASVLAPEKAVDDASLPPEAEPPPVPVVWLLGKVQAGKSSIVRVLTGSTAAEVGSGFKPCTKTARMFDHPENQPVIRFLDTRGIGEIDYDPAEDIAYAEDRAHLILVVMRALDHAQSAVVEVVEAVRSRRPEWPVVVVQTSLHDGYPPGADHVQPYPFGIATGREPVANRAKGVPADLLRSLEFQRGMFDAVRGDGPILFVPVDLTLPEDGYSPADYGIDALKAALADAAPAALEAALKAIGQPDHDLRAAMAHPHILGYAIAAGAADAVPVAGAVAVPGVQAKLLHSLGRIYGIGWDRQTLVEFGGCLGSSVLTRMLAVFGIRQAAKLVPVYGQTIGAAAAAATSFATTYALGKAACYFLDRRTTGRRVDASEVARTYAQSLESAFQIAKEQGIGGGKREQT